jgi:hypothetical protein
VVAFDHGELVHHSLIIRVCAGAIHQAHMVAGDGSHLHVAIPHPTRQH